MNRASAPFAALFGSMVCMLAYPACTGRSEQGGLASSASQAVAVPASATPEAGGYAVGHSPKLRREAGLIGLFFRAAEALEDVTSSERAAIAALEPQTHPDASVRVGREALRADLASGIRAGAIDEVRIAADETAVERASLAERDARIAALSGLHDALSPADRKAVAGDVRGTVMQRGPRHGPPDIGDAGPWFGSKRRLERLTEQLDLDASQQAQVSAFLWKGDRADASAFQDPREPGRRHLDALLTAFEQDSFDAGASLQPAGGAGARDRLDREVALLARLSTILRPDQRDKLAASIERPRGFDGRDPSSSLGDSVDEGEWSPTGWR